MLGQLGITVQSGICEIHGIASQKYDYTFAKQSIIYALDADKEEEQKQAVLDAKNRHDSVGGVSRVVVHNLIAGLGEPLYYRLDAILADAMMGINAVKAVEIGDGVLSAKSLGSENNDPIRKDGFVSNHAGGILDRKSVV